MVSREIMIANGKFVTKVKIKDILYIERYLRKIRIITAKNIYEYYDRLEHVVQFLTPSFHPCLQGCYVNFEKVEMMCGQKIIFENGQCIYLGRANFIKAKQAFKKYLINKIEMQKSACNCKENSV